MFQLDSVIFSIMLFQRCRWFKYGINSTFFQIDIACRSICHIFCQCRDYCRSDKK